MANVVVPEPAFLATLMRFGFSQPAIAAINANGLNTTNDLISLSTGDIENIMKIICMNTANPVVIPYVAQKRLTVFCYWVNRRHRLRESTNAMEFTPLTLDAFTKIMASETQDKQDSTAAKAPSEFETGSKWKPFKESVVAYFNTILTKDLIPLAYVVREDEQPDPNAIYENEHQRLVSIAPLEGLEFEEDNGHVYDYLKSWTLQGPAWTWMRQFNTS